MELGLYSLFVLGRCLFGSTAPHMASLRWLKFCSTQDCKIKSFIPLYNGSAHFESKPQLPTSGKEWRGTEWQERHSPALVLRSADSREAPHGVPAHLLTGVLKDWAPHSGWRPSPSVWSGSRLQSQCQGSGAPCARGQNRREGWVRQSRGICPTVRQTGAQSKAARLTSCDDAEFKPSLPVTSS